MTRKFLFLGSLNAMLAVILGAFGAHILRFRISAQMMQVYHTAAQYHFYHSLGLLIVGLIAYHRPDSQWIRWSGWLLFWGIVLFCGSLYALSLTGILWLGAITPIGGTAFIVAWGMLAYATWNEFK